MSHGEVDCGALRVYDAYDPQGLRGEGGVACLVELDAVVGPEEVEDGVEVGEGIGYFVGHRDGDVAGLALVFVNMSRSDGAGEDLDNG